MDTLAEKDTIIVNNFELFAVSFGLSELKVENRSVKRTMFMSIPIRYTGFILIHTYNQI